MTRKQAPQGGLMARLVFALLVGALAYLAVRPYGAAAPLGIPLPEVQQQITYEGIEFDDSSIIDNRLDGRLLEFLAPQADGNPPLLRPWEAASGSFTISHPYRLNLLNYTPAEFHENGVLAEGEFPYNQALKAIKYTFPVLKDNETHRIYVSRLRQKLEDDGVEFLARQGFLELKGYRFETLEYIRTNDTGEGRIHFMFIGPFGKRVLVIDMVTDPGLEELGRAYAYKIASTFKPGDQLTELLLESSATIDNETGSKNPETDAAAD